MPLRKASAVDPRNGVTLAAQQLDQTFFARQMQRTDSDKGIALPGCFEAAFFGVPSIVAVRVWPASDYTRLTIESDKALQAATGRR